MSHTLLLKYLESIGIGGIPLKLFENYLSNRLQCVPIKSERSELDLIKYGVPLLFSRDFIYRLDQLFCEVGLLDSQQLLCGIIRQHRLKSDLKNSNHQYNTTNKQTTYHTPFMCNSKDQRKFSFLGPKLFQFLPVEILTICSANI